MAGNLVELKAFVELLKDKLGFVFDVNSFDHRIMLQKYMFIAQILGWTGDSYHFSIYMHGPYLSALADDYYMLTPRYRGREWYKAHLPDFDQPRFLQIVQGKDVNWLEIGATILSLYNRNKDRMAQDERVAFVFERVKEIKSNFSEKFIADVFYELSQDGLLRYN